MALNKYKYIDAVVQSTRSTYPDWAKQGLTVYDKLLKVGFQTYLDDDGYRWFAFRPTGRGKITWLFNFIFPLCTIPYGNKESPIRIHTGFLADYTHYLREKVHTIMASDKGKGVKGYKFTGHSLGGVLCRLCAVDVQYNFHVHCTVRAFGQPNLGNKAFETSFSYRVPDAMYFRVERDPVPRLPYSWMGYFPVFRYILPRGKQFWGFLDHLPRLYFHGLESYKMDL